VVEPEVLSQRELRNRSGEVLRRVAAGESFVLTNNGVPVGRLVPLDEPEPPVRIDRPATRIGGWDEFVGVVGDDVDLQATLQELREDRL
jgi:prevent-host-death family protein